MKSGKMLVVYFTATNTTKNVAEQISKELNCDIYQIIPEKEYTSSDLNGYDENSRSAIEHKDRKARPKINLSQDPKISNYDTILIGFPIWWYTAPNIILTFLENFDFTGKNIVVWGTSWESDFEKTLDDLKDCCKGKLIKGVIFNKDHRKKEDIKKFVDSL